jgi:hypothetical protein
MKLVRFQALANSLGAEMSRWPESERAQAQALLESSPEARRIYERARLVDQLLVEASTAESAAHWRGGDHEQQAALLQLSAGVRTRISQLSDSGRQSRGWLESLRTSIAGHFWTLSGTPRGAGLATSAVAALLGLLLGWIQTAAPAPPSDVLTLLEASPLRLLMQ